MSEFDPEYRSPPHAVEGVQVRMRVARSTPNYGMLYAMAAVMGVLTGYLLTVVG